MSTDSTSDTSHPQAPLPSVRHRNRAIDATAPSADGQGESHANVESPGMDQQLINETRNQIRALVEEITELSQSVCDKQEFYEGFLIRCTQALASLGGAVWEVCDGNISLEYQVNLGRTQLADEEIRNVHSRLISRKLVQGEACLVPPNSGNDERDADGNPTEHLLVFAPLKVNQQTIGLIEIFQRTDSGPATQRGYLRFLEQMSSLANNYLSGYQLRQYDNRQRMWQLLDQFVRNVHGNLNVTDTSFAITNEGRRVIDCDRISLALKQGSTFRVTSVSGLDSIERRADQIKLLNRLVGEVSRSNRAMWYSGDDNDLPPQIETPLHDYIDLSHSKVVGIVPLRKTVVERLSRDTHPANDVSKSGAIIAALIIEKMSDESVPDSLIKRSEAVAEHGGLALSNAIKHNSILFAGLWQRLGQCSAIVKLRNLPKTLLVLSVVVAAILALCFVPYPFTLGASGKLIPEKTHKIFAAVDGTLTELYLPSDPGDVVQRGQILAKLVNNDLLVEIQNLRGQLSQTIEQIEKFNRIQVTQLDQVDALRAASDLDEAKEARHSLERQLQIKLDELAMLEIRAPESGRIVDWKLRENLIRRPVLRGQSLMTLVELESAWLVELELPERRTMHLLEALKRTSTDERLNVKFTLASHPGKQFVGTLIEYDQRLDVHSDNSNTMKLRVAFSKSSIPPELLRDGTRVTAKIEVGTQSIGYVWLHELFETVQSKVMFWL